MTDAEVAQAYRRYGSLVLRRCQRILRDRAAAEDALQDVFVRLWRYGNAFREAESKVLWLYRVADRCCFDRLARRGARAEVTFADQFMSLADKVSDAKSVEDRDVVMCFLDRFDDRVKQVAVLHYLDEMTQEEIAAATGWSRQTIFKKLAFLRTRAAALRVRLCGGTEQ
jgi:RNA polymerase sigma-70 factor (ECF subfamily)